MVNISPILFLLLSLPLLHAFTPPPPTRLQHPYLSRHTSPISHPNRHPPLPPPGAINDQRRKQLGIPEDQDEYDLGVALSTNTDAGITKIIAGSFILVMIALLVVGLVIPSLTDYGEGVCSPIQTGGRC
ncbi:hypothetical protein HJC23_009144 [Cyclotella cryptica]|uniref:Uncharacterized protein n=1 Tax=Cyclotella cryptica TaxID=29204 RepID=A0ABD3NZU7_9STRA|eukprot:CCRYP_018447-RA/>CCRYP_018447-RA protein AED:0.04 eAED:0.03 QI:0/-1/0/1/-1/1/1/0/128